MLPLALLAPSQLFVAGRSGLSSLDGIGRGTQFMRGYVRHGSCLRSGIGGKRAAPRRSRAAALA